MGLREARELVGWGGGGGGEKSTTNSLMTSVDTVVSLADRVTSVERC